MSIEGMRFVITGSAVGIGAGTARLAAGRIDRGSLAWRGTLDVLGMEVES